MKLRHAPQYGLPCIVVENTDRDGEAVIAFARMHGAISYAEGAEACVIEFVDSDARRVGPELYTPEAIRRTLARSTA